MLVRAEYVWLFWLGKGGIHVKRQTSCAGMRRVRQLPTNCVDRCWYGLGFFTHILLLVYGLFFVQISCFCMWLNDTGMNCFYTHSTPRLQRSAKRYEKIVLRISELPDKSDDSSSSRTHTAVYTCRLSDRTPRRWRCDILVAHLAGCTTRADIFAGEYLPWHRVDIWRRRAVVVRRESPGRDDVEELAFSLGAGRRCWLVVRSEDGERCEKSSACGVDCGWREIRCESLVAECACDGKSGSRRQDEHDDWYGRSDSGRLIGGEDWRRRAGWYVDCIVTSWGRRIARLVPEYDRV